MNKDMNKKYNLHKWKWTHKELSDQIDREFNLLGQRMTWLLTGNSFLLGGFILTLSSLRKVGEHCEKTEYYSATLYILLSKVGEHCEKIEYYSATLYILLVGIIIIGLTVCVLTIETIQAALKVIQNRKELREICEKHILNLDDFKEIKSCFLSKKQDYEKINLTVNNNEETSAIGNLSYKFLPIVILLLWIIVLDSLAYTSFSILKLISSIISLFFFLYVCCILRLE